MYPHTVDGGNPAPFSRWFIPLQSHYLQCFIVPNSYQLVQDFFHPQYHHISSFFGWLQLHQVADLESEEILRAAVSAAPVGCGPGNGLPSHQWDPRTKCHWSIYHEQNPIPKLSCCLGFIIFFHTFSWFIMGLSWVYHGLIIFLSCWAIPSIWVQRCPRACGSGVVWIHRALRRPRPGL